MRSVVLTLALVTQIVSVLKLRNHRPRAGRRSPPRPSQKLWLFEEWSTSADFERECIQERCHFEELSEIYRGEIDQDYKINKKWRQLTKRCSLNPCDSRGTTKCIQSWNERACICREGWEDEACDVDKDECKISASIGQQLCDASLGLRCLNTQGSFKCVCQIHGFGQRNGLDSLCEDIDECSEIVPGPCPENSVCRNLSPGYVCECNPGYIMSEDLTSCEDINECLENNNICSNPQTECANTVGSYLCNCVAGFIEVEEGACQDIDECQTEKICGDSLLIECINTMSLRMLLQSRLL